MVNRQSLFKAVGARKIQRLPDGWDEQPYEHLRINPCGPLIGAEISGLTPESILDPEVKKELSRALLEWKVLFLSVPNCTRIDQQNLANIWGSMEVFPLKTVPSDTPEVDRFEHHEKKIAVQNVWHVDGSWFPEPSLGAVLRALELPQSGGGDTMWCDTAAVYDNVPDDLKKLIDGRNAVHDHTWLHHVGVLDDDDFAEVKEKFPPVRHPMVRTHPETGRKCLFVDRIFTSLVDGMDERESFELVNRLCDLIEVPEFQVRHQWKVGEIAIWDNRTTQHYAVNDYAPERRVMERVTIKGDKPF